MAVTTVSELPLPNHFGFIKNSIIALTILNIGNYTFLSYGPNGEEINNSITNTLIYSRLPLSMLPWAIVLLFKNQVPPGLGMYLAKNTDFKLLVVYLLISSFFAIDIVNSFLYSLWFIFSYYSIILLLFFLSYNVNRTDYISNYCKFIVYAYAVILVLVVPSLGAIFSEGPEAVLFTSKTNYAYCLVAIAVGMLTYIASKKVSIKQSIVIFLIVFVCLVALLGSGKRSAFIVTVLVCMMFLTFRFKIMGLFILITVPIFFGVYQDAIYSIMDRYQKESFTIHRLSKIKYDKDENIEDTSYESRLMLWDYYLKIFEDYPLLGIGRNSREKAQENYKIESYLEDLSYHNTFLHILVEFGLIGAGMLLYIFVRGMYLIWTFDQKNFKFYLLLLLPTFIINWFETSALPGQIFFIYTFSVWLYPRIYLSPYFEISKKDPLFRR